MINQVVQANLEDSYYFELSYFLNAGYSTKEIVSYHFSDLSVDLKNCICHYN